MCGMMAPCMMACGLKTKLVAKDFMYGLMEGSMKGSGKTITCMEKVSTLGKMVVGMKVSI